MGIKGLTKFIAECGEPVSYREFAKQCIAVDAFQRIYKYCSSLNMWDDKVEMRNKFNKHLKAIMNCINQLIRFQIQPIFVFDGLAIASKAKHANKDIVDETINSDESSPEVPLETPEEKIKKDKKSHVNVFKISPQQIKECEKLIKYIGMPFLRAPYEADSQCAAITIYSNKTKKNISTIMTDDTDVLVFGAHSILKMLPIKSIQQFRMLLQEFIATNPNRSKKYSVKNIIDILNRQDIIQLFSTKFNITVEYDYNTLIEFSDPTTINFAIKYDIEVVLSFLTKKANAILEKLHKEPIKMTHENFVDMCVLFGTDYLPRLQGLTIDNIFEYFVESNFSIETFLKIVPVSVPSNFMEIVKDVKYYYENASVIDPSTIDTTIYEPNDRELACYLRDFGFSKFQSECNISKYRRNFDILTRFVYKN